LRVVLGELVLIPNLGARRLKLTGSFLGSAFFLPLFFLATDFVLLAVLAVLADALLLAELLELTERAFLRVRPAFFVGAAVAFLA